MSRDDVKDLEQFHARFVQPICALEEFCQIGDSSPIVDTCAMALRHILNDLEGYIMEVKQNDGK